MRVATHYVAWLMGLAGPETQTTARERDCLVAHAAGRRRLVEIGVWHGVTTARLRAAMDPSGELSAVDPFPCGRLGINFQERIARSQLGRTPGGRVRWVKATGAEAARGHGPVDFVFIDGDHSEAGLLADWHAWSGLVEQGGIVALHDSRSTPERPIDEAGSVKVTNRVILPDPRFETVDTVDSLTVLRRR
ncbi:MAG: class I SAM-dependent methyltransferase [Acidobacteria bacterium]|nr:MAG: class I SAM-dependent methyltransferase [Acidobacteriota bacterium]